MTSGGSEVTTVPSLSDEVVFDSNSGNFAIDTTANCKSLTQVAGYVGLLTHNPGVTIFAYGNVTLLTGRYVAGSWASTVYFNGAGNLLSAGNLFGRLTCAQSVTLSDNLSFIADQQCALVSAGNALNVNGKTISGNSITNRLIIRSDTPGTSRTITVNGGTFANCDFQDIAFANDGADLDLSAITGGSGDCGGNAMSGGGTLTFTAPSTQTFATTSGSWSDVAKWTSRVPLPQDLARFQPMSASQTITIDMPRLPDTDFSGCGSTNMPAVNLTTAGLTYAVYGSLNLTGIAAGGWSCTKNFTFASRSNASLTSNGQTLISASLIVFVQMPSAILTANDAIITALYFSVTNGTFNSAYNITTTSFQTTAGTITNLSNNLLTVTGSGNAVISNGTINAGTSTIHLSYAGASAVNFLGGTNTYNDITIAPGSGVLTFSGAFTFHDMVMSSAGTRSIVFTKATTYMQTGTQFLSGAGVDDAPIITPTLLNGGFETAGAGGTDLFASWTETPLGASTITRDTADKYAGVASCRFDVDASNNVAGVSQNILTVGRIYKYTVYVKVSDATGSPQFKIGSNLNVNYHTMTTSYAAYSGYFVADAITFQVTRMTAASKSIWIDDVTVTPLNSVLIQSSGAGEAFTLSKASGLIASNFLAIKDSIATGGAIWLTGYNSTNISGNTGWHFNSPASGAGVIEFVGTATAKALCRGIPAAAEIVFTATATAKTLCRAAGSGVIEFVGSCSAIVAAWKSTGLFKATERYIGQYFKASKRR